MDIIRTVYYIHGLWGDDNIFAVLCVTLLWALHIVIKRQFFTFTADMTDRQIVGYKIHRGVSRYFCQCISIWDLRAPVNWAIRKWESSWLSSAYYQSEVASERALEACDWPLHGLTERGSGVTSPRWLIPTGYQRHIASGHRRTEFQIHWPLRDVMTDRCMTTWVPSAVSN